MAIYFTRRGPAPLTGKRASDYAVGEIIKLNEDGAPVEYIVVHQGVPGDMYDVSCNGTWVLRKDLCETSTQWNGFNSSSENDYANSTVNAYLNGDWLNRFDSKTKEAIKSVRIPYRPGKGIDKTVKTGAFGLTVKTFLPSNAELSFSLGMEPNGEGCELAYFRGCSDASSDKRRETRNNWWTRTPLCDPASPYNHVFYVTSYGGWLNSAVTGYMRLRPAHILHFGTLFDSNNILKG